jgi:UDPglucose 6-dehydrogenase
MSAESAELAKYASNAYLAVKLSYANSLAALCARVGADIAEVTRCMGADRRIGPDFLRPGPGWGGSCLPKDTAALLHTARRHGVALGEVEAARTTNAVQAERITRALEQTTGRPVMGARVTVLGLTFPRQQGLHYSGVGSDMLFEMIPAFLEFFGFGSATPDELRATAQLRS